MSVPAHASTAPATAAVPGTVFCTRTSVNCLAVGAKNWFSLMPRVWELIRPYWYNG
ncbi:hypothetical protein OG520_02205 [Streptomyces sp. NBC_00984]|uniref:hypothetical protein n=1 Tax=Streptomyces sp. NBC_00984 TaxID=2903700 RepID=UPI0038692C51|nr:hypothetical protein OG520_02205 [Streptomyces sp. NBC_00984]